MLLDTFKCMCFMCDVFQFSSIISQRKLFLCLPHQSVFICSFILQFPKNINRSNCKRYFFSIFIWGVQNNILKVLRNHSWGNMFNSHQSKMNASKARHQYTQMGLCFSFTPNKIKLYTIKVSGKNIFFKFLNLKMQMSYTLTNIGYPKYTLIGLILSFTPTRIKLYTMKVYK